MTRYIAAYDTESTACLQALPKIVQVHRERSLPATFFLVGRVLDANADEYRRLLDDPLFEVASHSWSHKSLLDHPFCGPAVPSAVVRDEILRGVETVRRVFGRPCPGFRPGCGFSDGFRGQKDILAALAEAGCRYTSSQLWGPDYSMPTPVESQPFSYAQDGFPDLWELPAHGWHENLLKNHNRWGPKRLTLWPPPSPQFVPAGLLRTPEEEAALNRLFLKAAAEQKLAFVSLVWHPWSLLRFDPEMRMLRLTFDMVREFALEPCTYAQLREAVKDGTSP